MVKKPPSWIASRFRARTKEETEAAKARINAAYDRLCLTLGAIAGVDVNNDTPNEKRTNE